MNSQVDSAAKSWEWYESASDRNELPSWDAFVAAAQLLPLDELPLFINWDQRHRWKHGKGVLSEKYFVTFPQINEPSMQLDVVYGEILARQQVGEHRAPAEWEQRFPQLSAELRKQLEIAGWFREVSANADWSTALDFSAAETLLYDTATTGHIVTDNSLSKTFSERAPLSLDDFELQRQLGAGAMGQVHLACQKSLGKLVAVKFLTIEQQQNPQSAERFLQEARALATLRHPHIVGVHGVGCAPQGLFLVMDYIEGSSLDQRLRNGALPIEEAVKITATLAAALEHAHIRGIVHRDVKPSNVLVSTAGEILLTDFGLAKNFFAEGGAVSVAGQIVGTPQFMAPEQADTTRGPITPAADIYSLGAVLYSLLAGKPPFDGGSAMSILSQVVSDKMPPPLRSLRPEIPTRLEMICHKCLQKEPSARFASAGELREALLAGNLTTAATESVSLPSIDRLPRSSRSWLVTGFMLALIVIGIGIISIFSHQPQPSRTEPVWVIDAFRQGNASDRVRLTDQPAAVYSGDMLRIAVDFPKPQYLCALWIDSNGEVSLLSQVASSTRTAKLRLPDDQALGLPVTGTPGTEMLVLLSRETPWTKAQLQRLQTTPFAKLPALEPQTLVVNGTLQRAVPPGDDEAARLLQQLASDPRKLGPAAPLVTSDWDKIIRQWQETAGEDLGKIHYVAVDHKNAN